MGKKEQVPETCTCSLCVGCSMQHAVCIESICTIQTLSAHSALLGGIMHSAPALCIPYDSFLWPLLPITILGEFLHSAPASCIGTLSALSWLWVSFCIPHSASCILHVSHSCSFGPASAFCILHLHPASGAVHSFGADSAFRAITSCEERQRRDAARRWVAHSSPRQGLGNSV